MKLNIAYPATGRQKLIEIDDEKKLHVFYEKRMSQEVPGDSLGEQWAGYVLKITGGNDKEGFPMKQGVLVQGRVRLLLGKGDSCYRPRRKGTLRRKSVRGCIVGADLSVLALVIVRKGEADIPGLTEEAMPIEVGPKRANNIRKLFNLDSKADVRKHVIYRVTKPKEEGGKVYSRAPKIQRLITPRGLRRKRTRLAIKKARFQKAKVEKAEYEKMLQKRLADAKQRRAASVSRRRRKK